MTERTNRKEVDALLKQNARNVSNFGTGGKYDLKTKEAYDKEWKDIETKIMKLDPVIGKIIVLQDD